MSFERHEIVWTREKASRLWQFLASNDAAQSEYFSYMVGDALIDHVQRAGVTLDGPVLDYGCGPGYLLDRLLARGIRCYGADFDDVALTRVQRRLENATAFEGVTLLERLPSSLPSGAFDVVFLVETIEHLIGDELSQTLDEIRRVLRPSGVVIVTTPNEENLERLKVMCPECGCAFHSVQHVSSWSAVTLTRTLHDHGFTKKTCEAVSLRPRSPLNWAKSVAARVLSRKPHHLIYIGRKGREEGTRAHRGGA